MPPEKIQTLVVRLNWSNIIATIGLCLPILMIQTANHKEAMQEMRSFKDSALVYHANFLNHESGDSYIHTIMQKELDDHDNKIYQLANLKR